jgi:enamine deaminase RidA (YjgF/YER057c/UK114 family)
MPAAEVGSRRRIGSGSVFEKDVGFSRAVVDGDWIHVSGTTGFDYAAQTISDDPVLQAEQAFANIEAALRQAGASLADVVRVHYYITRRDLFTVLAPVFGRHLGEARPAATCLVCELVDPRMQVEIEVTARRHG